MILRADQLSKTFPSSKGAVTALENVTFTASNNEFICVVGPSGCGKSTLLRLIAGLTSPTAGSVVMSSQSANVRSEVSCALVFQEHGLFPWMTVLDNVAFGLEMQGTPRGPRRERARVFIDQFGLGPFAFNYPHELSVGMRQRVGIARAFLANPQLLLMDEPFGSLDAQTKLVLREELLRIWREHQTLVLYVTHDIEEAVFLGDRVIVMSGRPGSVRDDILIPHEYRRQVHVKDHAEIVQITLSIWKMLEEEVRKSLWIPG